MTANVRPGVAGRVQSYGEHPARAMKEAGVAVAVCCDNIMLSGEAERAATPAGEIAHLVNDQARVLYQ